ncbi:uncharacterized protein [Anoplolepis gracilipes]|uniref:uncharacterized protein isoform X2 n=1 Tax=Anoplolepis gracilipes TaxID=354296 RepID=UPI003B9FCCF4
MSIAVFEVLVTCYREKIIIKERLLLNLVISHLVTSHLVTNHFITTYLATSLLITSLPSSNPTVPPSLSCLRESSMVIEGSTAGRRSSDRENLFRDCDSGIRVKNNRSAMPLMGIESVNANPTGSVYRPLSSKQSKCLIALYNDGIYVNKKKVILLCEFERS